MPLRHHDRGKIIKCLPVRRTWTFALAGLLAVGLTATTSSAKVSATAAVPLDPSFHGDGIRKIYSASRLVPPQAIERRGHLLIVSGNVMGAGSGENALSMAGYGWHGRQLLGTGYALPLGMWPTHRDIVMDGGGRPFLVAEEGPGAMVFAFDRRLRPRFHWGNTKLQPWLSDSKRGGVSVVGRGALSSVVAGLVDSHDRILLAGTTSRDALYLARLTSSGQLDTAYGTNGHVQWRPSRGSLSAPEVARLAHGAVLVAGSRGATARRGLLTKWDSHGKLIDLTARRAGRARHLGGHGWAPTDLARDRHGHTYIVLTSATSTRARVIRLERDFDKDLQWGTDGRVTTRCGPSDRRAEPEFADLLVTYDAPGQRVFAVVACGRGARLPVGFASWRHNGDSAAGSGERLSPLATKNFDWSETSVLDSTTWRHQRLTILTTNRLIRYRYPA